MASTLLEGSFFKTFKKIFLNFLLLYATYLHYATYLNESQTQKLRTGLSALWPKQTLQEQPRQHLWELATHSWSLISNQSPWHGTNETHSICKQREIRTIQHLVRPVPTVSSKPWYIQPFESLPPCNTLHTGRPLIRLPYRSDYYQSMLQCYQWLVHRLKHSVEVKFWLASLKSHGDSSSSNDGA